MPEELRQFRYKTAMKRTALSRPISAAIRDRVLTKEMSFFDFGCGYGSDVELLQSSGFSASGWDPHFHPKNQKLKADVVNLGFVLNVIEDPKERSEVFKEAFGMAQECLVVAVRIDSAFFQDRFGDGSVTRDGSFQKIYSQAEFRSYAEGLLGKRIHLIEPGIGYVFKKEAAEQRYLSNRYLNRLAVHDEVIIRKIHDAVDAEKIALLVEDLGRIPSQAEVSELAFLGKRKFKDFIETSVIPLIDKERFASNQNRIREDILQALAMTRIENHKFLPAKSFSLDFQSTIKEFFSDYKDACKQAEELLFALGKEDEVRKAGRKSPVGKILPDDLYVHQSALEHIPVMMKLMLSLGESLVGRVSAEVIKFSLHGKSMSFLFYESFDNDPHPKLMGSIRVDFRTGKQQVRDYAKSDNPPILHRKETFLLDSYPLYSKFKTLTEQEEAEGLLGHNNIGFSKQWEELLFQKGLYIEDHKLMRRETLG